MDVYFNENLYCYVGLFEEVILSMVFLGGWVFYNRIVNVMENLCDYRFLECSIGVYDFLSVFSFF